MTTATPTKAKTSVAAKPPELGRLIDEMWALREKRKIADAAVEALKAEITAIEEQIEAQMDAQGITKASGAKATLSFSFSTIADVQGDEGWTKLYAYIKKTGYWHLLHRRVTDGAYAELLEAGKKVPGVEPFVKKRINLRTIPS
jgi:hypothetical protein